MKQQAETQWDVRSPLEIGKTVAVRCSNGVVVIGVVRFVGDDHVEIEEIPPSMGVQVLVEILYPEIAAVGRPEAIGASAPRPAPPRRLIRTRKGFRR